MMFETGRAQGKAGSVGGILPSRSATSTEGTQP